MKNLKSIIIIIIITILFVSICTYVYADPVSAMDGLYSGGSSTINRASGKILGIVQAIGISVAVIMLAILSIKYFASSIDERAEVKKKLIPFVIGAFILFAASSLVGLVARTGAKINEEAQKPSIIQMAKID